MLLEPQARRVARPRAGGDPVARTLGGRPSGGRTNPRARPSRTPAAGLGRSPRGAQGSRRGAGAPRGRGRLRRAAAGATVARARGRWRTPVLDDGHELDGKSRQAGHEVARGPARRLERYAGSAEQQDLSGRWRAPRRPVVRGEMLDQRQQHRAAGRRLPHGQRGPLRLSSPAPVRPVRSQDRLRGGLQVAAGAAAFGGLFAAGWAISQRWGRKSAPS